MSELATIAVAVVGLGGGFLGGRQTQKGALAVAKEETVRLHREIDEKHFEHRMVAYHNVLMFARQLETSEREGYHGMPRFLHDKFRAEADGLAVFGAAEPRRLALEMAAVLNSGDATWLRRFLALRDEFADASVADVGPKDSPRSV